MTTTKSLFPKPNEASSEEPAFRCFLPIVCPTTTSQMKRMNRKTGAIFKGKTQKAAEATVYAALDGHRIDAPIPSPVSVEIKIVWPWRKSDGKAERAKGEVPHTVKPDGDNVGKGIQDLLSTMRFIEDDAGVCDKIVRKRRGDRVGIEITIRRVER